MKVFRDEGVSGNTLERPGLQDMLAFLESKKNHKRFIVIVDTISSLARNMVLHLQLRNTLDDSGAKLESLTIKFDDSPTGRYIENIMAARSEIEAKLIEDLEKETI